MPHDGLQLALVGVGRIGLLHARTVSALPDVSRLTIADLDVDRAAAVAAGVGAGVVRTPEELLDLGVDALVIATSTPGHVPLLRLAAEAGVAAFCEKPVALDVDVLDRLIEQVDRVGILVQVGFQRRVDAGYVAARDTVAEGRLGTLLVLRAATHDPMPPADEYIAASGGIFRDLHIHDFDAIRFVTGQEVSEVYADGSVRETPWFAEHGDVDAAAAVLRLDDGALAVLTGTRHDALGSDVRLEGFGSRDSVGVGVDDRTPLHSLEPGAESAPAHAYRDFVERFEDAYRSELEAFVAALRHGGPSPCTLADARAALAVALAAGRSRAEHRPVSIEEVASAETVAG